MTTGTTTETVSANGLPNTDLAQMAVHASIAEDAVQTELSYLVKDPKHEDEKPYVLRYDSGGLIPNTNMTNVSKPVNIHNFRALQKPYSFKDYGFSLAKLDCTMTDAEYYDEVKVRDLYYPAIVKFLRQEFPDASDIKFLGHELRKRHAQFPTVAEELVETRQPATAVHIDYSPYSAARTARAAFKIESSLCRRLVSVNLWKSIQGPGNDWPLALCDARTIDHNSEVIAADVVFVNRFTENQRLYYSPRHEWYYCKDLGQSEIIMFRQTDSDIEGSGGVAHASFFNPSADEAASPRESIELRAFIIWE